MLPAKLWSLAVSSTTLGVAWCSQQDYVDFLAQQPLRDTCSSSLRQKYMFLKFTFPLRASCVREELRAVNSLEKEKKIIWGVVKTWVLPLVFLIRVN